MMNFLSLTLRDRFDFFCWLNFCNWFWKEKKKSILRHVTTWNSFLFLKTCVWPKLKRLVRLVFSMDQTNKRIPSKKQTFCTRFGKKEIFQEKSRFPLTVFPWVSVFDLISALPWTIAHLPGHNIKQVPPRVGSPSPLTPPLS